MMKKILSAAVVASVVMVGALPAFAEDDVAAEPTDALMVDYDDVEHMLLFSTEGGECTLTEEMVIEYIEGDDGSLIFSVLVVEPTELPPLLEGCVGISVEGPNGQVNHGTFVSSLMHALKELGIKGSDKKEYKAALAGFGKGDMQVKAHDDDEAGSTTDDSATLTGDASDHPGKPDKGNQSNKSSNGRGHNK